MANPLEILNITNVAEITTEQFTNIANTVVAMPALIILFIAMSLIFLLVGLFLVKKNKSKIVTIWFISVVLSVVVLMILIFSPNAIQSLMESIKGWFV